MSTWIEVIPAYGKDYKNAAEAKNAWKNGADFVEATSRRYCSVRDFPASGGFKVIIRYAALRKVTNA